MTKHNGELLIANDTGPLGYLEISGALVSSACDYFFKRRGMSSGPQHGSFNTPRYPCGKKRPEGPRIARIRRTDLSRSRQSKIENRDSKISS